MIDIMKKVRKRNQEPADNFATFDSRLDTALGNLTKRHQSIGFGREVLSELVHSNQVAAGHWASERRKVTAIIQSYKGDADGYSVLNDLLETATRMEELFNLRRKRAIEKEKSIDAQGTAIMASIAELQTSKDRLGFSRMLHEDREKLRQTAIELGGLDGLPAVSISDGGLPVDLKNAREAIAMAEALLEVKGV